MQENDYCLGFSLAKGIGPKTFSLLLRNFGSAQKAWDAKEEDLLPVLKPKVTQSFLEFRRNFDFGKYKEQLATQKISVVSFVHKNYPSLLKEIPNPPVVLYAKGNLKLLDKENKIAIVGTRHITNYGRQITEMFAEELASDFVIVSGMALGVDAVSHESCLKVKGETIAVLGNGVDLPYPYENQKLYEEILDKGGLIISEYPPGMPPSSGSFPARNRIVAGISKGILVTEGASDSGSLITANLGLSFNRKVFAVPGPITSPLSKAPLDMISKGAKLVTSPQDILREFSISSSHSSKNKIKGETKEEKLIIKILENESLSFDEIIRETKIDSSVLGGILSMMELKGFIKVLGNGNLCLT